MEFHKTILRGEVHNGVLFQQEKPPSRLSYIAERDFLDSQRPYDLATWFPNFTPCDFFFTG